VSKQRIKTQKLSEPLVIIFNRALIRAAYQQSKSRYAAQRAGWSWLAEGGRQQQP